jgi:hypothetical protein
VAAKTAGQMAIGTIDCTTQRGLCDEYKVRGYPTLKFSLDGDISDYPGGRKEEELLFFAAKMVRPVVQLVNSVEEAEKFAAKETEEGVAFLAYHPDAVEGEGQGQESDLDKKLQKSRWTQVYAQVARSQKAYGHFALLEKNPEAAVLGQPEGKPFVCRLEANVPPHCFESSPETVDKTDLLDFVRSTIVPTVSHLGPHNFHKVSRSGRPLVIGAVSAADKTAEVAQVKQVLTKYALEGPAEIRDKYYYGWLDGKAWSRFLEQFDVLPDELPQIFVLNVPKKTYWQNATYQMSLDAFLAAVQDGTVKEKVSTKKGFQGVLDRFMHFMVEHRPWSVVAVVLFLVGLSLVIFSVVSPGEDLRPPYERIEPTTTQEPKTDEGSSEKEISDESKKDK